MPIPGRRLTDLGTTDQFVVSALRLWVLPHCDPTQRYPDWQQGFHCAGLGALGASSFDALCRILATASPAGLQVHALMCSQLGVDEARLLHTLWLVQQRQLSHAHAHLTGWCCATAARLAMGPASTVAVLLQSQHMRMAFHYVDVLPPPRESSVDLAFRLSSISRRVH